MPTIIQGSPFTGDGISRAMQDVKYDYDYPDGLSLRPGSEVHERIKNEVLKRARESHSRMSARHSSWRKIDETLTAYIPLDDEEARIKSKDPRKPVSIIFPHSYAVLETLLTYMTMAFFQDPIFGFEGSSPEDTIGATMLEKVIDLHVKRNKVELQLHTMFRDSFAYGIGAAAPYWKIRRGMRRKAAPQGMFEDARTIEQNIKFEGNALAGVDPYKFLPDTNVSIHNIQDGEYCGFMDRTSYNSLLNDERDDPDNVFNVRYLSHLKNRQSSLHSDNSRRDKYNVNANRVDMTNETVDVCYMHMTIIPREWKLGESSYPEKWTFALAADEVVIEARSLEYDHNMYPIVTCAPDYDGYSVTPLSRIEVLYGLQGTLDWLFNSHVANVRKAINDMLVVDPYLVNMEDLKDPQPGKLIRLRRPAWGRGVDNVVKQLNVQDVTQGHIGSASFIVNWMNNIGGADESMMGALRKGGPERLTSKEFQGTRAASMSRLERVARVIGTQAMQDIGYMFAANTQQLMSQDVYIKTAGRWEKDLMRHYGVQQNSDRMKVSPMDLLIDYDVMIRDGSVPGSNFSEAWIDLFQIIMGSEQLHEQFDISRIFMHIAKNLGAKNVNDFLRDGAEGQVMQDEQVLQEAERGNIVPVGQALGSV